MSCQHGSAARKKRNLSTCPSLPSYWVRTSFTCLALPEYIVYKHIQSWNFNAYYVARFGVRICSDISFLSLRLLVNGDYGLRGGNLQKACRLNWRLANLFNLAWSLVKVNDRCTKFIPFVSLIRCTGSLFENMLHILFISYLSSHLIKLNVYCACICRLMIGCTVSFDVDTYF